MPPIVQLVLPDGIHPHPFPDVTKPLESLLAANSAWNLCACVQTMPFSSLSASKHGQPTKAASRTAVTSTAFPPPFRLPASRFPNSNGLGGPSARSIITAFHVFSLILAAPPMHRPCHSAKHLAEPDLRELKHSSNNQQ